ncbi:MAG: NUDIX domain-containing protein [Prevotella sp.]|jgi:mutator protein MutT
MHPLEKFKYCPVCGSRHFEENSKKSKRCENCGFEYFLNPSASNVAFILNEKNELLVLRRSREPAKGMLDLPGGFADIGETAEQGVIREVREETGLNVTRATYLFSYPNVYLYSGFNVRTLDSFFRCEVESTENVKASDDAADFRWVPLTDIHFEQFGLRSVRQGLYDFVERIRKNS